MTTVNFSSPTPARKLTDQYYMAHALRLAEKGLWTSAPNPRVGCVIVNEGKIVGEGWHQVTGEPHAEIRALQMAKEKAAGATCYVTLEPCCHQGRTPPCTDALIKAGIKRVVIAMADPNPLVCNKGIGQLTKAGIMVDTGILSHEAEQLNPGFLMRMRHNRPYIRCKMAMSLDGRTAMASGESRWITSQDARRDVQCLRARSSAIITGVGTILSDDPRLTVRDPELSCDLSLKPVAIPQPLRVIVDTHLSMPTNAQILSLPGKTLIFTANNNQKLKGILEAAGGKVIYLPARIELEVDLKALCHYLAQEDEVNELLIEAGATLSGSMLRAGLVDELVIYMAPRLMGNKAHGLFHLPDIEQLNQSVPLDITEIRAIGCDWRITAHPILNDE